METTAGTIPYIGNMGPTSRYLDLTGRPDAERIRKVILEYHHALQAVKDCREAARTQGRERPPLPPWLANAT